MLIDIRQRVKELRWVPAHELIADPRNWRGHPEHQRQALRVVMEQIGFAGAILAREEDGELIIMDGHLRADDVDPETMLPVLVTDCTEDEAGLVLATYDPIGAMASSEDELLQQLLGELKEDADEELSRLLTVVDEQNQSSTPVTKSKSNDSNDDNNEDSTKPKSDDRDPVDDKQEFVIVAFRMTRRMYEAKMDDIAEAVKLIGITPHVQDVN